MDPASQEKTAFITYSGLYVFQKMPYGLVNAPATLMQVVLADLISQGCLIYIDDLIVIRKTLEEHDAHRDNIGGNVSPPTRPNPSNSVTPRVAEYDWKTLRVWLIHHLAAAPTPLPDAR